ncbi:MAG: esterase/lipase family protein, partial [Candidatus Heimdallarchaeota archaeon]
FHTLMRKGYELLAYSQKDVAGDINISVKELELVIKGIQKVYGNRRLVLVGHSRGGLCIRKYIDTNTNSKVEKIITLSTPHGGSHLTNLKIIKEPAIHLLNDSTVKGIWDVSGKRKIRAISYEQMQPKSEFLLNLNDREKSKDIEYITAGGTNPNYAHVYTWSVNQKITKNQLKDIFSYQVKETTQKIAEGIEKVVPRKKKKRKEKIQTPKQFQWIAYPKKILTIFEKLPVPEIRNGDGLVALQSAILKDATRKYKINANHEEIAVCEDTKKLLLKELNLTRNKN